MPVIKETVTMKGEDAYAVARGLVPKLKEMFENNGFSTEVTNSTESSYAFSVVLGDTAKLNFWVANWYVYISGGYGSYSSSSSAIFTGGTTAEVSIAIIKYLNDADIYVKDIIGYRVKEVTYTDGTKDTLYFPYEASKWYSKEKSINVTLQNLTTKKPYEDTKIIYSKCGILYSNMIYGFFDNVYDCLTTYSMVEGKYTIDGVEYYHKSGYLYRI